jgi:ribonuclease P protein component
MKGEQHLNRAEQFKLVYESGSSAADRFLVLRAVANGLEISRFGISVSKRVGNAVVRNRTKRRLREILRLTPLPAGRDFIMIARAPAAEIDYREMEKSARSLLNRLKALR